MDTLSIGENIWSVVFVGLWLVVGMMHLWSLRTGAIMGITAGPRAIKRSARPGKFWAVWFLLAWPFVFLPALALTGLALGILEK